MTKSKVIADLYSSRDLDTCITKLVRRDHRDDFKQELILILCEKHEDVIMQLHNSSGLTFYVVRIILNLLNQKRNIYHRTYNDPVVIYDSEKVNNLDDHIDLVSLEERLKWEDREAVLVSEVTNGLNINKETFYYRKIVEAVDEHGGVRAAAEATGIPRTTISRAMAKVREYLTGRRLVLD